MTSLLVSRKGRYLLSTHNRAAGKTTCNIQSVRYWCQYCGKTKSSNQFIEANVKMQIAANSFTKELTRIHLLQTFVQERWNHHHGTRIGLSLASVPWFHDFGGAMAAWWQTPIHPECTVHGTCSCFVLASCRSTLVLSYLRRNDYPQHFHQTKRKSIGIVVNCLESTNIAFGAACSLQARRDNFSVSNGFLVKT